MKLTITYQFEPAMELPVRVRRAKKLPAFRRLLSRLAGVNNSLKRETLAPLVPKLEVM